MADRFTVIIPARYASSRLPGKPLKPIAGKPMLQHVHEAALASGAEQVIVATDDERIEQAAQGFDADVCMTSADHPSGTDRLAEVTASRGLADDRIIVNLQGDEPLMPPELIHQVADGLASQDQARIATLATPLLAAGEYFDPNFVKVVTDRHNYALYFSRAPIPWDRDLLQENTRVLPVGIQPMRHIGIYAYRVSYLRDYAGRQACSLEQTEHLEQLRALWYGEKIYVATAVQRPGPGVDSADDLQIAEELMLARQ